MFVGVYHSKAGLMHGPCSPAELFMGMLRWEKPVEETTRLCLTSKSEETVN